MGLIADIVESVKNALGSVQYAIKTHEDWADGNRDAIVSVMADVIQDNKWDLVLATIPSANSLAIALQAGFEAFGVTPKEFVEGMFRRWSDILNDALGNLNIDAPDNLDGMNLGDPAVIDSLLRVQGDQAEYRVAAAVGAINLVLALGNAVSILSEAVSAGTVRSIAEAVQSWIWANGLGQLSSMAYQPQLDASVNPLLQRSYNYRSQSRIPDASDLIRFQLREVYDEDRREELLVGKPRGTFNSYMRQNGYSEYHSDSFWAAHWVLPSVTQLNEMLFRGVIDSDTWRRFVQ